MWPVFSGAVKFIREVLADLPAVLLLILLPFIWTMADEGSEGWTPGEQTISLIVASLALWRSRENRIIREEIVRLRHEMEKASRRRAKVDMDDFVRKAKKHGW